MITSHKMVVLAALVAGILLGRCTQRQSLSNCQENLESEVQACETVMKTEMFKREVCESYYELLMNNCSAPKSIRTIR